ncbi:uncharacterized protein N7458_006027 [Penicillium daleae]|uniref:NAD-dependent epimerase/dehydratase domain-containing protein n=1 Tax=Penicillium daleae TaxID=63821 RepID=A0AAD6G276_9EURO|nr:uncharacterized protein N7458_006027 [Penicillium daleae]KAJ5449578.1 hypothetical protein N7458_006027 [Penicillium daleae]
MGANILVTGACGYIGGSIVADFARHKGGLLETARIHAAVRSDTQAESLSTLDVTVVKIDLSNPYALAGYMIRNDVSIVIHTATSIDPEVAQNLITALKKRREANGKKAFFVHTSGLSAFDDNNGWPFGLVRDIDPVYFLEKQCTDSYIVRQVDVLVAEQTQAAGLTGLIVMPPTLHGRGSGTWNRLSPQIPALVKAAIKNRQVYRFEKDRIYSSPSQEVVLTHISDLTTFYAQLTEAILQKRALPAGMSGYYFTVSHSVRWWDILDRLAEAMHARGLVDGPTTRVWPSDSFAAEALGVPVKFARSIWDSSPKVVCLNKDLIGWKPVWNRERLLQSIDQEIDDYLELGMPKSSLLDSLRTQPQLSVGRIAYANFPDARSTESSVFWVIFIMQIGSGNTQNNVAAQTGLKEGKKEDERVSMQHNTLK